MAEGFLEPPREFFKQFLFLTKERKEKLERTNREPWTRNPPPLNLQFYRALNIRVALVGLEVWSDMDKCPITQDPFTTLHEFLDWRKVKLLPQKPHDNAQLIR